MTLKLQTQHGQKVHGLDGDQETRVNHMGREVGHYTLCDLLVQPGDKMLPRERKVTCKKCLRTLNRVGA